MITGALVIYAVANVVTQHVAGFTDDLIWEVISNSMYVVGDLLGILMGFASWFGLRNSLACCHWRWIVMKRAYRNDVYVKVSFPTLLFAILGEIWMSGWDERVSKRRICRVCQLQEMLDDGKAIKRR